MKVKKFIKKADELQERLQSTSSIGVGEHKDEIIKLLNKAIEIASENKDYKKEIKQLNKQIEELEDELEEEDELDEDLDEEEDYLPFPDAEL